VHLHIRPPGSHGWHVIQMSTISANDLTCIQACSQSNRSQWQKSLEPQPCLFSSPSVPQPSMHLTSGQTPVRAWAAPQMPTRIPSGHLLSHFTTSLKPLGAAARPYPALSCQLLGQQPSGNAAAWGVLGASPSRPPSQPLPGQI
jgi:hypothetical protein